MVKKGVKKVSKSSNSKIANKKIKNGNKRKFHRPSFKHRLTFGQKASDKISEFGGSWIFIISFLVFLVIWMVANITMLKAKTFDPYPFILLNLVLSCLAALQAPIILMAQNRQADRDRLDAKYDHQVNRKAEREIQDMQKDLEQIKQMIRRLK